MSSREKTYLGENPCSWKIYTCHVFLKKRAYLYWTTNIQNAGNEFLIWSCVYILKENTYEKYQISNVPFSG